MSENESTEATPTPDERDASEASGASTGLKNPDTTGADASPEAGVKLDELTEDERDREIRYS